MVSSHWLINWLRISMVNGVACFWNFPNFLLVFLIVNMTSGDSKGMTHCVNLNMLAKLANRQNQRIGGTVRQRVKRLGKMIRYQRRSVNQIKKLVVDLQKWQNEANGFCCDKRHYRNDLTKQSSLTESSPAVDALRNLWEQSLTCPCHTSQISHWNPWRGLI